MKKLNLKEILIPTIALLVICLVATTLLAVTNSVTMEKIALNAVETEKASRMLVLPEGKEYWCYSWTRGKLIIKRGGGDSSVNDYTLETRNGETYMFVDLKSYNFRRGGVTTTLVL